jgi:hypothetical protein
VSHAFTSEERRPLQANFDPEDYGPEFMPKSEETLRKELERNPQVFARHTDELYFALQAVAAEIEKRSRDREQTKH